MYLLTNYFGLKIIRIFLSSSLLKTIFLLIRSKINMNYPICRVWINHNPVLFVVHARVWFFVTVPVRLIPQGADH